MQALRECRHKTEQAWQSSIEISTDMTYVFQNDVSIAPIDERLNLHLKTNVNKKSHTGRKIQAWKESFLAFFRGDAKAPVR
jgi:hypothetical protein